MEEKMLRSLTIKSISFMITVFLISVVVTRYNQMTIYADENLREGTSFKASNLYCKGSEIYSYDQLIQNITEDVSMSSTNLEDSSIKDILTNNYIRIEKPDKAGLILDLEDLYMTQSIRITIENLEERCFSEQAIISQLEGVIQGTEISYEYNQNNDTYTAIFHIMLDKLYVQEIYQDFEYIYINLRNPHDVYEKILVIDAGHGGNDIGTYSENMENYEKDINLKIVLYLKELFDQEEIKVYYTRLTDEKVYLNPRKNLANTLKADFFVSIHCNGDTNRQSFGTEVLYNEKSKHGPIYSEKLASFCLEEIILATNTRNRGLIKSSDTYIIGNSTVPVALVEAGFMSNENDMEFLSKEENLRKVALGIFNGILKAYEGL